MRMRLGGRAASREGVGRFVYVSNGAHRVAGVVLFVDESSCDVWLGDNVVRRVAADDLAALEGIADPSLRAIAVDVEIFDSLAEGIRVQFEPTAGAREEGMLIEKCRFGALVLRADGAIVGVGFRRVRPLPASSSWAN